MSLKKIDRIDCRINLNVKLLAKDVCRDLGMSLTEAINLFLHQLIIHHGLPFDVKMSAQDKRLFLVQEETDLPDQEKKEPLELSTREKPLPDEELATPDTPDGEELLQ